MWVGAGDSVSVVMTKAAKEFVTPLSFQTLSRNPVFSDQFAPPVSWKPEHISLAESADLVVVAPATANIIAKIRYGLADDLLSSVLLATRAPIAVAPAMNDGMWESPVTQDNIAALEKRGITVIGPEDGELACGTRGKGRMMDPQKIFEALK
jgi:phosphopantothenoylcysteine decarboxylase/phosphopantothenate--cysteine ligase